MARYEQFKSDSIFQTLAFAFIRPPRLRYDQATLDKAIRDSMPGYARNQHIIPVLKDKSVHLTALIHKQAKHYVLFCHGNSSCRVQALSVGRYMNGRFNFCFFDFVGCGNPQPYRPIGQGDVQYLTLGLKQSQQIKQITAFLKETYKTNRIVLWGRSMGAASILFHGGQNINVLDSPFHSIRKVSREVIQPRIPWFIPDCLVNCTFSLLFCLLNCHVQSYEQLDLNSLQLIQRVQQIPQQKRMIFVAGHNDTFIDMRHSIEMYRRLKSKQKELVIFQGSHNSQRPRELYQRIYQLIEEHIESTQSA